MSVVSVIYRTRGILLGVFCLAGVAAAMGQATAPAVSVAVDGKFSGLLDPEYRDDARGLRFCPPAGVRLASKAGNELVSFVQDQKNWVGSVHFVILTTKENVKLVDYLKSNADALNKTFTGVIIEESDVVKLGDQLAGRQNSEFSVGQQESANGKVETAAYFKQDVMVQMAMNQFVHLTMFSPLKDKEAAKKTYDAMLSTFSIVDINKFKQQMKKNEIVGQAWLSGVNAVTADDLAPKLLRDPRYMKILVQDKEMGYVRFEEGEEMQGGNKGVTVKVQSYSFPGDGSILMSTTKAWWAYMMKDGQPNIDALGRSSWEALVRSIPAIMPVGAQSNPDWSWQREKGSTVYDINAKGQLPGEENKKVPALVLTVNTEAGKDQAMAAARVVPGTHVWAMDERFPQVLPKVLEFTWPRLVDLSKPLSMSFPVYNSGTRKMGLRTISVLGEETVTIDGKSVKAVHLTDELDNGATAIWVDKDGKILLMKTTDGATLVPTTQQEMDRKYQAALQRAGK